MIATISADVVSSTQLSVEETLILKNKINSVFCLLESKYPGFWGRQIKGDYIECVVPDVPAVLRIALILKTAIKSLEIDERSNKKKFQNYGLRLSIGIGDMRIVNRKEGIIDGEAIYSSGRGLEKLENLSKGTMSIHIKDDFMSPLLNTIILLVDALVNDATRRQSEVLYYKLLSKNECDIAEILKINQAAVNQRSMGAKWYCVEETLKCFEMLNFDRNDK